MTKPHYTLVNGEHVHFRRTQMLLWSVIAGLLGAGFIAGLYFGILQANWHLFTLKPWWDGLFKQAWWPTYRHTAFRDIPEPAFATMGVMTLLAKPKYWKSRVSTWRLAYTPLLVIVLTFALGIAGTWLLNYAFGRPVLATAHIGDLLLGFVVGKIMHFLWAPVGATIQGNILDDKADKAARTKKIPFAIRWPVLPPVIRERFADMYRASKQVAYNLFSEDHTTLRKWVVGGLAVVFTLVTALGLVGHYWVGTGHTIPFIMPV
jgi:hypothetical protein